MISDFSTARKGLHDKKQRVTRGQETPAMYTERILGQKIRYYRNLYDMTQQELAEVAGVEPLHIANIESGRRGIKLERLIRICRHFHVNLSDILPMEEQDDAELRSQWTDELMDMLDELDIPKLRIVMMMARSLMSE